jgi:NADH-quinone oxidoreductase subunit G
MSDDLLNLEVNGVPLKARKGQMIMQVTDPADIYIPRFCYHEKLTVAANCRMCLVEVEKAPKPLPACATPVAEGMKVFTRSPKAVAAQRATMEFLLINHPLDCPICDQGGECELQDLAMGFGRDISRFAERKRVVKDKNLGPLISTDMTRCIHCTRCIRFGQEIQGYPQMGTTGRGEHMEVGTYIEQAVDHELSANIIDLCPVGALNNKPFRYHARSWEMQQQALVSPHDAFGTNLHAHVLRGRIMRMVPRENEAINETWIADRDRFGFEGMYSAERALQPLARVNGALEPVEWETALELAAQGLQAAIAAHGAASAGFLISPQATLEEMYLLARIARGVGSDNIDHRLRQLDFRAPESEAAYPGLGIPIAALEMLDGILIIGSDLRREMPMLAHRVRKAALRRAQVAFLNPRGFECLFPVTAYALAEGDFAAELAAVVHACAAALHRPLPAGVRPAAVDDGHRAVAAVLTGGERRAIILGNLAQRHPAYSELKALAGLLATVSGATLGLITEGPNSAGAYLAGAVPHREPGGVAVRSPGRSARSMLDSPLNAYLLFGGIDPLDDLGRGAAAALGAADLVIAATTHLSASLAEVVDVVLPIGSFAESSGTYVNLEGRWQSWSGAAKLLGDSRPGWKVLRVLANLLAVPGVDYISSEDIREALRAVCGESLALPAAAPGGADAGGDAAAGAAPGTADAEALAGVAAHFAALADGAAAPGRWLDIPPYQVDVLVRGSEALAKTKDGRMTRDVL